MEITILRIGQDSGLKMYHDIKVNLKPGNIYGFLGDNQSGKTELLDLLCGAGEYKGYRVKIMLLSQFAKDLNNQNKEKSSFALQDIVSYIPLSNVLKQYGTVGYMLDYFTVAYDDFDRNKAKEYIKNLDISINTKTCMLSPDKISLLRIIMTFSRRTFLYLLDMPFAVLDLKQHKKLKEYIYDIISSDNCIVVTTNQPGEIEGFFDRVYIMKNSQVVKSIVPEEYRYFTRSSIEEIVSEV